MIPPLVVRDGERDQVSASREITTVVFDAYGTLFDVNSVETLAEDLYPGHGAAITRMWRQKQIEYMWLRSLMGRYEDFDAVTEASFRYTCSALDLPCDAAIVERMMGAYLNLAPVPEAAQALEALSGYRRVILSNGSPRMLTQLVRNTGLDQAIEQVISVDDIRVYKPHPRVYELATTRLGVEPWQIAFVSSNFWDVSGAASFGLPVFWINRRNARPDPLGFVPDAVLGRLTELPDAITRARRPRGTPE